MQAIATKYLGPTNHRGSRVKATAWAGSITVSWDHRLNSESNHRAAAEALAKKFGWVGTFVGGGRPECNGNIYVNIDADFGDRFTVEAAS